MEPSFAPKKPLRSGFAVIIDLAMSADFTGSPAPYWTSTTWMFGCLAFIWLTKPSRRVMPVCEVWSWTMTPTLPESPIRPASLSASTPAAAMLSVATVVTGMSLSTPESKPTTGMFAVLAWFRRSPAALLSSAAKQTAAGFALSAVCSIVSCLSTSDSVAGPWYVAVTPSLAASSRAPFFTACQNWCCSPLEMIAMVLPFAAPASVGGVYSEAAPDVLADAAAGGAAPVDAAGAVVAAGVVDAVPEQAAAAM